MSLCVIVGLPASTSDITDSFRKMTLARNKNDHGSVACLIEYAETKEDAYRRECDALKLLEGVPGVVQLVKTRDDPDKNDQRASRRSKYVLLTVRVPGSTLREFVREELRGGFGVLEAIKLVQHLIIIVNKVHSKDVFHQNIGPENIMINWDSKKSSIDEAELTLINFSQVYIKSAKNSFANQSTTQSWYQAPQANVQSLKYLSTIDVSSICALLLWLLTDTDPKHTQNMLPHQQENVIDKLNNKIAQAVRNAST